LAPSARVFGGAFTNISIISRPRFAFSDRRHTG